MKPTSINKMKKKRIYGSWADNPQVKLTSFGKPIKTDRGAIVDARKDVVVGDILKGE